MTGATLIWMGCACKGWGWCAIRGTPRSAISGGTGQCLSSLKSAGGTSEAIIGSHLADVGVHGDAVLAADGGDLATEAVGKCRLMRRSPSCLTASGRGRSGAA